MLTVISHLFLLHANMAGSGSPFFALWVVTNIRNDKYLLLSSLSFHHKYRSLLSNILFYNLQIWPPMPVNLLGQWGPTSTQSFCLWYPPFGNNGYPPFKSTTQNQNMLPHKYFDFISTLEQEKHHIQLSVFFL